MDAIGSRTRYLLAQQCDKFISGNMQLPAWYIAYETEHDSLFQGKRALCMKTHSRLFV
jgi:hypothetical protein